MKIIKRICFVIILAGILLGAMILVPFYKHVNTRYAVTIYDFNSNEELQYMEARVSGEYEYYLFGINSRTRLNCDVVVLDADDKELQYYPAVSAYTKHYFVPKTQGIMMLPSVQLFYNIHHM
jgi:hypothetical protein